jgi:site-specific DNA-adenine methylase
MRRIFADAPLTPTQKSKRYYLRHREHELERNAEYHRVNRAKIRVRHRFNRHATTQEEYDIQLRKQRNRCAVCRKEFTETPHIDHCHKTLKNRGILCVDCNLGLGRFKDSIELLSSAIKYLRRHNGR